MGQKTKIYYLALGDSLTVGVGAPPGYGFVNQFKKQLEKNDKRVYLVNFGSRGITSSEVLKLLVNDSDLRSLVREADIITLSVGGNDLLQASKTFIDDGEIKYIKSACKRFRINYAEIISTIKDLKKDASDEYTIRVVDIYNPFPQIKLSGFWVKKFNKHIRSFEDRSLLVSDVYHAFLGREEEFISSDQIHPNEKGYKVIAEQINQLGASE